jgi:hypothetical protein
MGRRPAVKRALLALAAVLVLANVAVVVVRTQKEQKQPPAISLLAAFNEAVKRHDYRRAYALTDLTALTISGGSSAVTLAHFTAFVKAHGLGRLTLDQDLVHVPTTNLRLTATTGPLPSLAVDGVSVSLLKQPVKAKAGAAAWRYTYVIVVISGPHALTVGPGPVTAARSLTGAFKGDAATLVVTLGISSDGDKRVVEALDSITRTCSGESCLVTPCSGSGPEYVLDAWGIGTPPIVGRALVGASVIAPMPPNGWSIAITFLDQGQPPGLSGSEQTAQIRARFVFGFVGRQGTLLDRCWVSHR